MGYDWKPILHLIDKILCNYDWCFIHIWYKNYATPKCKTFNLFNANWESEHTIKIGEKSQKLNEQNRLLQTWITEEDKKSLMLKILEAGFMANDMQAGYYQYYTCNRVYICNIPAKTRLKLWKTKFKVNCVKRFMW